MSVPLWLIGAGNMGGAILRGWLASGIDPAAIAVVDPFASSVPEGVTLHRELPAGVAPDILVIAVKPQQLSSLADACKVLAGPPRLMISVLAGVETPTLSASFGAKYVVRAMPNLPAAIGEGATVLYCSADDAGIRAEAEKLMVPLGTVDWIDEETLFDAVTALSGSGPGYVFRFIEALAEAGTNLGLPSELAERLAATTVRGAASMAVRSDATPATLADQVASPGGTTREGLNVLDADHALKTLIVRTLEVAAKRSAELAAAARG
ncbi:MAG: pyrroline-5-carboxylate reductase [Sphingomonadaceae bacterium]